MPGTRCDGFEHPQRLAFVLRATVVERDGERLALDVVPVDRRGKALQPFAPVGGLRHELEAVLADVDELVEADDAARVRARAAADAGDERVALVEPRDLDARLLRHDRLVRNATIGASTPSTSSRIAVRPGSSAMRASRESPSTPLGYERCR